MADAFYNSSTIKTGFESLPANNEWANMLN